MDNVERTKPEVITSLWNLPCEQCRIKTRRFNLKLNARLCSEECEAKFLANPKKKAQLCFKDCRPTSDEIKEIDHLPHKELTLLEN